MSRRGEEGEEGKTMNSWLTINRKGEWDALNGVPPLKAASGTD